MPGAQAGSSQQLQRLSDPPSSSPEAFGQKGLLGFAEQMFQHRRASPPSSRTSCPRLQMEKAAWGCCHLGIRNFLAPSWGCCSLAHPMGGLIPIPIPLLPRDLCQG